MLAMKLLRYEEGGGACLVVLQRKDVVPLPRVSVDDPAMLAVIERPGKYPAIGMNSRKHVEQAGDPARRNSRNN